MKHEISRRTAVKAIAGFGALGVIASAAWGQGAGDKVAQKASATGNWLIRGDKLMIVHTDPDKVLVMITNVIGDKIRVHVLDDPTDDFLGPGESTVRKGMRFYIDKPDQDKPCIAYGTFTVLG